MQQVQVSSEYIREALKERFELTDEDLKPKHGGAHGRTFYAQMFYYCLWTFTDLKLREIAEIVGIGLKDIHKRIGKIKDRCLLDDEYRAKVIEVENLFE